MRFWKAFVCAALVAAIFTGCNTVRGVGKDVERGGAAVQRGVSK